MTPIEFITDYIRRWEGGLSLDRDDTGNWVNGRLIGSKYGVTAPALARHRGRAAASITAQQMADLTLAEAAQIGKVLYYDAPRFDLLPWNRVTASIVDFGWGAGPAQSIKLLQRMLDVADDGRMGPNTAAAYKALLDVQGEVFVAGAWWTIRDTFYELIIGKNPANTKFEKGWDNRSRYFTPGDREGWWGRAA